MVVVNTLGEGVHELSIRDGTSKVSAQTTNNSVAVKLTSCNNEVTPFKIICWQHHWMGLCDLWALARCRGGGQGRCCRP